MGTIIILFIFRWIEITIMPNATLTVLQLLTVVRCLCCDQKKKYCFTHHFLADASTVEDTIFQRQLSKEVSSSWQFSLDEERFDSYKEEWNVKLIELESFILTILRFDLNVKKGERDSKRCNKHRSVPFCCFSASV